MNSTIIGSRNLLAALAIIVFGVAGAILPILALSAAGGDHNVEIAVKCEGAWTGTLEWTLDGVNIGEEVLDCPDDGDSNFKLKVGLPSVTSGTTGSPTVEFANDLHIAVTSNDATSSVTGALPSAECMFNSLFDPDDLKTVKSEYVCGNSDRDGDDLAIEIEIEQGDDDDDSDD